MRQPTWRAAVLAATTLLTLLLGAACGGDSKIKDARTVTVEGAFTFEIPGDMTGSNAQGVDSLVGAFQSVSIRLEYDFGTFSDALGNDGKEDFRLTLLTVDGRQARIERFTDTAANPAYPYVAAIHFPELDNGNLLTIYASCKDEDAQDVAVAILRSVRFIEEGS